MLLMLLGIALFFGPHTYSVFRSRHPVHSLRTRREAPYMAIYSLLSLAGLVLIVQGYQRMWPAGANFGEPPWGRWFPLLLMWPAFVLFVAGNLPPGRIRAVVKHPMVLGTFLWAASHLFTGFNGRKLLLFFPFAAWALLDFVVARRRPVEPREAKLWPDLVALGAGSAGFAFFLLYAHTAWIDVSPLG